VKILVSLKANSRLVLRGEQSLYLRISCFPPLGLVRSQNSGGEEGKEPRERLTDHSKELI
jgi:hypothetical protein